MEDLNFFNIISGSLVLGLCGLSFYLWIVIFTRLYKGQPVLEKNNAPQIKIGAGLVLAAIYFYLSTPRIISHLSVTFKLFTNNTILSHTLLLFIAALIYLIFYRNQKIKSPQELISEFDNDQEETLDKESVQKSHEIQKTPRSLWNQIEIGYNGFLIGLLPVMLVLLATFNLRTEEKANPILKMVKSNPNIGVYLLAVLIAVALAPLIEELIFRVLLQGFFTTTLRMKTWTSILTTAILFSAVHGFPDAYALLPLALVLGYIYHQTRSYVAVVVTHACFNGFNIINLGLSLIAV